MASNAPTQLPAYIQLRYEENGVFDKFESDADAAAAHTKRRFEQSFKETERVVSRSLGKITSQFGKLDLGVGDMRQQSADIRLYRDALEEASRVATQLAKETGDTSSQTQQYLQALAAQRTEADRALQVADAQVATYTRLQGALDGAASASSRLAQSQREQYAEAARAAQAEVAARDTQSVYASNYGIGRAATDNGASFSALADREAMDVLRRAEAGLVESGRLLEATHRNTALALDHTAKSARDSAAAFMEADRAQQAMADEANVLRQALDPALAVQQRFDAELARADKLLEAGAISTREYANAQELARTNLTQGYSALFEADAATKRLSTTNDRAADAAGRHRFAMQNLSYQLQDVMVQAQMGTSWLTIFAQQGGQIASALGDLANASGPAGQAIAQTGDAATDAGTDLQGLGDRAVDVASRVENTGTRMGRFAAFMAGPWGAAMVVGVAVLAPLIASLFETEEAAKAAELGTSGLAQAQGVMGEMFDLASGKIEKQNELLVLNARLTALNLRAEALKQRDSARETFGNFSQGSLGLSLGQKALGALGVPVYGATGREQNVRGVLQDYQSGKITREKALQQSETLDFSGLAITKQDFQQALVDEVSAEFKDRTAKLIDESLDSGTLAEDLRRPGTTPKKKERDGSDAAARAAEQLARFSDQAADAVSRISDKFSDQPRLISQASAATRDLDGVIADIDARLAKGGIGKEMADELKRTKEEAIEAKSVIEDALVRPVQDMRHESEKRLAVQGLLAQGRSDEAAALDAVYQLEDKLGNEETLRANVQKLITQGRTEEARILQGLIDLYPDLKRQAAEVAVVEQRRTRELERQRALFEAQLDVLDQSKRSLTDLLSGRSTNFFKDVGQALKDLQGKRLFDSLFGDTFQQLEDQLRGQSPLGKESSHLAREMTTATSATEDLAKAFGDGAAAIRAAAKGANDNELTASMQDGADVVVKPGGGVTRLPDAAETGGKKAEVDMSKMSVMELAKRQADAIVEPFQKVLNDTFGTAFGQMLGSTISGAIAGKLTGGTTGGILGGLKGLVDQSGIFGGATGGVSGALGQAGAGAATGTMSAGIMKSLGLKTSTTGAQIGGAVGSFIPIPGGQIIGSVVGGLIGGLFKGNTTAGAVITNGGGYTVGGKDSGNYGTATGLGDSVLDGLNNVVDKLGGTIGDFMVTIGTRGDEYRVNPNGNSLKIDKGAISFGDDAEAAIAFAIKNAIEDGAIKGMRASTLNIIKAGDDIEKALDEAVTWENAFKELRKYKDPLGAAMDDLDDEFDRLIEISKTAGASAQEMADLEELYGIKRNEIIKEQAEALIGSLTSLYKDLTTGDNGLSLRDRRANALTDYDALSARVKAGDTTAYDDYADAAQQLLDIERELYGSQQEYFDRLNEVTDLTKTRIDAETNVTSIAENRDSPFDSTGAVKSSIDSQTETLGAKLDANTTNQGTIIALLSQIAANGGTASAASTRIAFASSY